MENDQTTIDRVDRRILALLQRNNQLTNLELASHINLSPPTCLRRVRRLREAGTIMADVSIVNPLHVGKALTVFVEVSLERQSETLQRAFEAKMEREPEVSQCYMVSGDIDFMVVAQVTDMQAYHRLIRRALTNDANIRNFRSLFAMNRTKFRTEIDLRV